LRGILARRGKKGGWRRLASVLVLRSPPIAHDFQEMHNIVGDSEIELGSSITFRPTGRTSSATYGTRIREC
jgi:hypothetical protein